MSLSIRHQTASIDGKNVFYREAGDPSSPALLLLHGFPSSSHMFRHLIPLLADRFYVIAPDYIGFGQSDAPDRSAFIYSFDNLTRAVTGLIDHLGLESYILYMQDFGGPVGFRIFVDRPHQVAGFVIQNTNAYLEGVGDLPRQIFLPLWARRDAESEAAARQFLAAETTKFQYLVGAKNPESISPDNWMIDQALLDRPGVDLLEDYKTNVAAYDTWHAAFRAYRPKTLIVWGRHDPFFIPAGAEAYLRDLPEAKLVWLDAGHFVLDENAGQVAAEIKQNFLVPELPADIIRTFYAALAAGDAGSALALMSADIEWVAMWPYKARGPGPQNVAEGVFMPLQKDFKTFEIVPSEYVTEGDLVLSIGRFHGVHAATCKSVDAAYAHLWTVRGGRITRFRQYIDTLAIAEAGS
jgi:pimeloyl-ACP methyl ester carboxylesterase/ketosteroid isomerase-like protein